MTERKDIKNTDLTKILRDHVYKLYKLLMLKQTGHFSWIMAVSNEWKAIAELWSKPEKTGVFLIEYLFHNKWCISYSNEFFTSYKEAENFMKNNKGFLPLRVQGYARVPKTKKE